jgi:hypothetical protein
MIQPSLPYNSTGRARVEYNFILVFFLNLLGLKMLLIIPVIVRNFDILLSISSSFLYDTEVPILLLSITILLLLGYLSRNVITLDFSTEIVSPSFLKILFKFWLAICNLSSEAAIISWSSAKKIVVIYFVLEICIHCCPLI